MNTFLLPLGVVVLLLVLARRFVRHRENLHERHERLLKLREDERRDMERRNTAMQAAEALAPLRLALRERLEAAGFVVEAAGFVVEAAVTTSGGTQTSESCAETAEPVARLVCCNGCLEITKPAENGTIHVRLGWEEKRVRFSSLQGGRETRSGVFVLHRDGCEEERHHDLAATEWRCVALLELPTGLPPEAGKASAGRA